MVLPRTKRQQYQLLSQQPSNTNVEDSDDESGPSELDLHRGYARPQLVRQFENLDDEELSDYVLARLEAIRTLAMEKYKEQWG